ncbi:MAG: SUMF1/EgtB/PvdO family nonheme iron enzyme [Spirochaetaceae bacterium]|nr:SUMF1/EgtB/PvdO family nonheme iron enzyme [Spirochaetaceae bacterium]
MPRAAAGWPAGHRFAGSGDWATVAWYYENSGNRTQLVGRKLANELWLYDMSDNVREWVEDCYQSSYSAPPATGTLGGEAAAPTGSHAAAPGTASRATSAPPTASGTGLLPQQQPRRPLGRERLRVASAPNPRRHGIPPNRAIGAPIVDAGSSHSSRS